MGQRGSNPQHMRSDESVPGTSRVAPPSDGSMPAHRSAGSVWSSGSMQAHQSAGSVRSSGSNLSALDIGEKESSMKPVIIGLQVTIAREHKMKV